ncbi:FAD-dependent thymidylate synthase [Salidesulfovibrio brasiliensis]|uniref:FAD-dependent thymidylate synthase n=1 Tax=Salidesulfovibrio brasiliensis TaxID=221711 RepID=UPI0006D2BEE2|nr:FAD-dependent thymidylate synthase [Salidesulfovibrio brasiliensis]
MKIVSQKHEILRMDGLEIIERAGRTCYKSESKIGCTIPEEERTPEICREGGGMLPGEEARWNGQGEHCDICARHSSSKFSRMLRKRGHEAMIEHGLASVWFRTNRGVTHELVRHRMASFGQESTRYVNYGNDDDIQFIRPFWVDQRGQSAQTTFEKSCMSVEKDYLALLDMGCAPEEAREVLPNSLKTEIVVTANYREWRHIFALRAVGTTGRPHPQMKALMMPLLEEFAAKLPPLFEDLLEQARLK